ncbi:MAG: hypothetical protein FWD61_15605 [Phycisphaerales bacterium]|nr:hypothetical protein [Phycisphaerales bacterium]
MKMKEELKLLEERRRAELKHLHATYLRTKREVRRATSADRAIRKHMAISLGVAVLAGLILAPRLGGRRGGQRALVAKMGRGFRILMRKVFPKATSFMPDMDKAQDQKANGSSRGQRSMLHQLFTEIAVVVLTRLNLPKLVAETMKQFKGRRVHEGNGHAEPLEGADPVVKKER